MGKKIGILGGTFNPIHLGHINFAIEVLEKKPLDEIWFCPAWQNPFKSGEASVDAFHRLNMIRLAIAPIPQFKVLDYEIKKQTVSYTVETLRYLIEQENHQADPRQYFLMVGGDAFTQFFDWRQPEEIVRLAPIIIGSRDFSTPTPWEGDPRLKEIASQGLLNMRIMEISSTEVRNRLAKNAYAGHLIPKEVLDYIKEHHLYLNTEKF